MGQAPTSLKQSSREPAPADLPEFGSAEHLEWIARRLAKNLRFRDQVEAWTREALATRRMPVRPQRREPARAAVQIAPAQARHAVRTSRPIPGPIPFEDLEL